MGPTNSSNFSVDTFKLLGLLLRGIHVHSEIAHNFGEIPAGGAAEGLALSLGQLTKQKIKRVTLNTLCLEKK